MRRPKSRNGSNFRNLLRGYLTFNYFYGGNCLSDLNNDVQKCSLCKKIKPLSEFHKSKNGKYGVQSRCKECSKKCSKKEYEKNKERMIERHREYLKNDTEKYKRSKISSSLSRHRKKGYGVIVTIDECMEMDNDYCYYCGCKLEWEYGTGHSPESPTIDRISNDTILTKENIVFVCNSCNAGKSNGTIDKYIARCERVVMNKENILAR